MTQNFNRLKCLWYGCVCSHTLFPMLAGAAAGFCTYFLFGCTYGVVFSLLWVLAGAVLEWMIPRGWPRFLVRELTPNFYAVRHMRCYYVFQRMPKGSLDCRQLLRDLLADRRLLPAALPPGRYRAVTHEAILRRLEAMENASVLSITPAYTASMAAIHARMLGDRCKTCKHTCILQRFSNQPHSFYDVRFTIYETKR